MNGELNTAEKDQEQDSPKGYQKIFQVGKFLLLIGLFIALFWIIPFDSVWSVFKEVDLALLTAGIVVAGVNIYFRSIRIYLLTEVQDLELSALQLLRINLETKFYMLFLPGAIVGSGIRWAKVSSEGKSAEALAAVAFNRVVEAYFIVVTGIFWYLVGLQEQRISLGVLALFLVLMAALWLVFVWLSALVTRWFNGRDGSRLKPRWQPAWRYIQKIAGSINLYAGMGVKYWAVLFGVSVVTHLVGLVSYGLVARAAQIEISIIHLAWTQAVIQLASLTPISIAGGLGLREVSLVVLLPLYGVSSGTALAFSLLLFVRNIVLSLIGGLSELAGMLQRRSR